MRPDDDTRHLLSGEVRAPDQSTANAHGHNAGSPHVYFVVAGDHELELSAKPFGRETEVSSSQMSNERSPERLGSEIGFGQEVEAIRDDMQFLQQRRCTIL